ncbi:hypothetical protein AT6N2_C0635 [Agrobacterium tumefaciens]|nr:hypothetical protein AT6N2_C0635 [Agrobacterium tumefaciens]
MFAERFRRTAHLHAFHRRDDADDQRHERRLDHAGGNGRFLHRPMQARQEHFKCDAGIKQRDNGCPEKRCKIGKNGQKRQRNRQRHQPREDEHANRIETDHLQRVDFLAHLHRADFSRDRAAGATGDHDRGQENADFTQLQNADEIDDEDFGTEIPELERALLGDDRADQEGHQHDDRHGAHAHMVDLVDDRRRRNAASPPELHLRAAHGRAENIHPREEIRAVLHDGLADRCKDALGEPHLLGGLALHLHLFRQLGNDLFNLVVSRYGDGGPLRLKIPTQTLDDPGTGGVDRFDGREIDFRSAGRRVFLDLVENGENAGEIAVAPGTAQHKTRRAAGDGIVCGNCGRVRLLPCVLFLHNAPSECSRHEILKGFITFWLTASHSDSRQFAINLASCVF